LRKSITLCWSVELNQGNALVGVNGKFEVLEVVHCDVICDDENALQDEAVGTWNLGCMGKKKQNVTPKLTTFFTLNHLLHMPKRSIAGISIH
jgi:hypothetical protein